MSDEHGILLQAVGDVLKNRLEQPNLIMVQAIGDTLKARLASLEAKEPVCVSVDMTAVAVALERMNVVLAVQSEMLSALLQAIEHMGSRKRTVKIEHDDGSKSKITEEPDDD